jgi:hypothetical protein
MVAIYHSRGAGLPAAEYHQNAMPEASPAPVVVATRSRLTVSEDGRFAAWTEAERVVVLALPSLTVVAEIGIHADAVETEVTFVGSPPRMVVLSRHADVAWLHIIDPRGPAKLGDATVPITARVAAVSGDLVLLATGLTASVIDTSKRKTNPATLPLRDGISAAAGFGKGRFLILVKGVVEEWDGQVRVPARRFHFGEQITARFLGGNAQRLWFVPAVGDDRVEIRTLIGTVPPQRIALPAPLVRVIAGPHPDALIGLTAAGQALVIDLQGRHPVAPVRAEPVVDAAWETPTSLLVIDGSRMVRVPVDVAAPAPLPPPVAAIEEPDDDVDDDDEADDARAADDDKPAPVGVALPAPIPRSPESAPAITPPPAEGDGEAPTGDRQSPAQRLSAWRKRVGGAPLPSAPAAPAPAMPLAPAAAAGWRNDLVAWAGAILDGRALDSPPPSHGALARVAAHLELDEPTARGLGLAYGAYLRGVDRIAPIHLARVFGGWDEAIGAGILGASGALRWSRRAIVLSAEVIAALDERGPLFGTIVRGTGGADPRRGALIVPGDLGLVVAGPWAAGLVGDVLVPTPRGQRWPRGFVREARVRGLLPLVPWAAMAADLDDPPARAVVLVEDRETAAELELAVLGTWDAESA